MRAATRAALGLGAIALSLALPGAAAVPIDGDLLWRNDAEIQGTLVAGDASAAYFVQHFPPNALAGYTFTLASDHLDVVSYSFEESVVPLVGPMIPTGPPARQDASMEDEANNQWTKETYDFTHAAVEVALRPTGHYGSTALFYAPKSDLARFAAIPAASGAYNVRSLALWDDLMRVPSSNRHDSGDSAYEFRPSEQLLDASGDLTVFAKGTLQGALFGWDVNVVTRGGDKVFHTGVHDVNDPLTGIKTATVLEYLTIQADDLTLRAPAPGAPVHVYTPILRYLGEGHYPSGFYSGQSSELAPTATTLPVGGDIWLGAEAHTADARDNLVRTWGEATWIETSAATVLPAPRTQSFLPLAAASAGLLVLSQFWPTLGRAARTGAFLLYARLKDQSLEDNETRHKIYDLVHADPGLNLSGIVNRLGLGWGTAAYHTMVLKRQNKLRDMRVLNRLCFFPNLGSTKPDQQQQTVLLRQPNYRSILQTLSDHSGLSKRELAETTGHARQYVSRLLTQLDQAKLVRWEKSPMGRKYFAAAPIETAAVERRVPRGATPEVTHSTPLPISAGFVAVAQAATLGPTPGPGPALT